MNSKTANKIPIRDIVETIGGLRNGVQKGSQLWYYSPFREEKTRSFSINIEKNNYIDFGRRQNVGTPIDFVMELRNCTVSQALSIIEDTGLGYKSTYIPESKQNQTSLFSSLKQTKEEQKHEQLLKYYEDELKKELREGAELSTTAIKQQKGGTDRGEGNKLLISNLKSLNNIALLDYLSTRQIDLDIAKQYCNEIYFKNIEKGKNYFAISFTNDSGAYEWRNKYSKGILGGSKDITSIYDGSEDGEVPKLKRLLVFEGFMDFLSYKSHKTTSKEDYIILNSVALVGKFLSNIEAQTKIVYGYTHIDLEIHLYLDNDNAGDEATEKIKESLEDQNISIIDKRTLYAGYKDYNEYLCSL